MYRNTKNYEIFSKKRISHLPFISYKMEDYEGSEVHIYRNRISIFINIDIDIIIQKEISILSKNIVYSKEYMESLLKGSTHIRYFENKDTYVHFYTFGYNNINKLDDNCLTFKDLLDPLDVNGPLHHYHRVYSKYSY